MSTLQVWLRKQLRNFGRDCRGNIALTFALAVLPVIGCVGAAIDYSRANAVKASLQTALDSTALMLSKDAATLSDVDSNGKGSDLDRKATAYFMSLFTRKEASNIKITASFSDSGGSSVVVNGSADVPTSIMEALGFDKIGISGSSTAKWGTERLRVALALDVTGSMSSAGKIDALKEATGSLLTQLKSAATKDGDVYVSIIPFSKDVNFGNGYDKDDPLMDLIDWSKLGHCSDGSNKSYKQCIAAAQDNHCHNDDHDGHDGHGDYDHHGYRDGNENDRVGGSLHNLIVKVGYGGGGYGGGGYGGGGYGGGGHGGGGNDDDCNSTITWIPDYSSWTGCITDRGGEDEPDPENYDQTVVAPDPDVSASKYPADDDTSNCPPVAMTGLNYDWDGMQTLVNSMQPRGSTNQPIGLVWAWQSLVGGGPLTVPPKDTGFKYQEFIILLSDGLNTQNRWYGNGRDHSTDVDERMLESNGDGTCANIKDTGITIYTLQVNTDGDPTSTLLQSCASDPSKFYLITKAADIAGAFDAIADEITKLRVAR